MGSKLFIENREGRKIVNKDLIFILYKVLQIST